MPANRIDAALLDEQCEKFKTGFTMMVEAMPFLLAIAEAHPEILPAGFDLGDTRRKCGCSTKPRVAKSGGGERRNFVNHIPFIESLLKCLLFLIFSVFIFGCTKMTITHRTFMSSIKAIKH